MIKNILKTIILVGPTILPIGLLFIGDHQGHYNLGIIAFITCVYFLLFIWKKELILKIPAFFRGALFMLSFFVWFGFFGMSLFALAMGSSECGGCVNPNNLIAQNGEQFDLSMGKVSGKAETSGFMDCSCGKVFSYENNSVYALSQIEKMGDYWQYLPDCSSYTLYDYAEQTSFDLNGECYLHKEDIRDDADITLIYNKKTNKLLYLFYSS